MARGKVPPTLSYHKENVFAAVLSERFHFKKSLRKVMTELYIRDNCHPFKATLLVWVQIPVWVCVSLALRNCSVGVAGSEGDSPGPSFLLLPLSLCLLPFFTCVTREPLNQRLLLSWYLLCRYKIPRNLRGVDCGPWCGSD